jgi:signal transduction histidine kinase
MEAAKGRLAASIAHEINNPLEAITNLGYLIAFASELSDGTRESVQTLNAEIARVSDITRQALAFYRDNTELSAVSVNSVLDSVLELFQRRFAQQSVALNVLYAENIPSVIAKAGRVEAGSVESVIQCPGCDWASRRHYHPTRSTPHHLRITISDNGQGIPSELRPLIFEAFETTEGEKGTGLGLWVSKGLIEKYGGSIRFRSSQNTDRRGTVFSVVLPRPTTEHAGAV